MKGKNNNAQIANETQARNILVPSTEELQIKKSLRSRTTANDPGMARSNVSSDKIATRPAPSGENSKGETSNSASQPLSDTLQDKEVNHVRGKHSKTATTDNNTTDLNDNYRDTVMLDVTQSDDECFQDPHNAVDPQDLNEYDDFTSSGESTDSGDNSADDSYSDDDNSSSESDSQGLSETSTSRKTDLMGRRQIALDPAIKLMMEEMVQEGIHKGIEEYSKKKTHGRSKKRRVKNSKGANMGKNSDAIANLPISTPLKDKGQKIIKSPSDTTLYKPALAKGRGENDLLNRISNFVENIRLETLTQGRSELVQRPSPSLRQEEGPSLPEKQVDAGDSSGGVGVPSQADKVLLQAEHFKADLSTPKGNVDNDNNDDFSMWLATLMVHFVER